MARAKAAKSGKAKKAGKKRAQQAVGRGAPSARDFSLERFLPYRLSVVTNRVSRAFARRYSAEFGLTIPEWRVIAVVGGYAPLSSNEICRLTEMDKAKVSRAVTRLAAAGLLTREPDPQDQRLLALAFTRKGRKVYEAIVPLALELERELTDALEPAERALLERALMKLYHRAASPAPV